MLFNAVNGNGNLRITIFAPFSGFRDWLPWPNEQFASLHSRKSDSIRSLHHQK
jgi:hypothetical protein